MARKNKSKDDRPLLVEFRRHIAGPPRRSPGMRVWLTPLQIKQQRVIAGTDFVYVKTERKQDAS